MTGQGLMRPARAVIGAAVLALAIGLAGAVSAETLRVLAWQGYADDDWVKAFEEKTGATVEVVVIGTDDELWAKIQGSGGQDFDVLSVNTAQLQRYIDAKLVQPINLAQLPNQQAGLERFRDLTQISGTMRDGAVYGVPYAYDAIGLIYDPAKVVPAPTSWSVLWDPQYKGRILAYDNGEHSFSFTSLMLGSKTPFRLSDADLAAAKDKLVELKHNIPSFYATPDEALQIYQANDVALVFANYGQQQVKAMKDAGLDVAYVNPSEGALAWLDTWAITVGARDVALAHAWIDFLLDPAIGSAMAERTGFGSSAVASAAIGENDNIVWLESVEDPTRRSDLWNEVKATP